MAPPCTPTLHYSTTFAVCQCYVQASTNSGRSPLGRVRLQPCAPQMVKKALEGKLFHLAFFFRRLRRPPVELRPKHLSEPGPTIRRRGFTLHSVEKTTDVSVRPVGVVQCQGLQRLGPYRRAALQRPVVGEDGVEQAVA